MKPKLLNRKELWNKGFVELWDFSEANKSQEHREEACALVASACRNVTIKNPKKLYKRLLTEHDGHPSEIFQFIPVKENYILRDLRLIKPNPYWRYGYFADTFLTNHRNIINNNLINNLNVNIYNDNCSNFMVFRIKIPYMIVDHLRRHKLLSSVFAENWQSNRSNHEVEYFENNEVKVDYITLGMNANTHQFKTVYFPVAKKYKVRKELLNKGEFGLRYVTGWIGAWYSDPDSWHNFLSVRTKNPTQKETKELAEAMYTLLKEQYGEQIYDPEN